MDICATCVAVLNANGSNASPDVTVRHSYPVGPGSTMVLACAECDEVLRDATSDEIDDAASLYHERQLAHYNESSYSW